MKPTISSVRPATVQSIGNCSHSPTWCARCAALLLAGLLLCLEWSTARAEDAAPASAAVTDALRYFSSSTSLFVGANVDAAQKFLDSIEDTPVGKAIQQDITDSTKDAAVRDLKTALSLLYVPGRQFALGVNLPEHIKTLDKWIPDLVLVVTPIDPEKDGSSIETLARLAAKHGHFAWKEETEGAYRLRVPVGGPMPDQTQPSYAVVPEALVIGLTAGSVRSALQQLEHPASSMANAPELTGVVASVDRSQLMWGLITKAGLDRSMGLEAEASKYDISDFALFQDVAQSSEGAAFSVGVLPNHVELHAVRAFNDTTQFGKLVRSLKGNPLKAPALISGRSIVFVDASDMTHVAPLFNRVVDDLTTPGLGKMLASAINEPQEKGYTSIVSPMLDISRLVLSDLLASMGDEAAFSVGPVGKSLDIPPMNLMVQKSDNPRQAKWIQDLADLTAGASSMEWYSKDFLNAHAQILGPTSSSIRPCYGEVADFNVISSSLTAFKTPVYLSNGQFTDHSMAANPRFQEMLKLLGPDPFFLTYLDFESARDVIDLVPDLSSTLGIPNLPKLPGAAKPLADAGKSAAAVALKALRAFAVSLYPDPAGIGEKIVLTYDLNAVK